MKKLLLLTFTATSLLNNVSCQKNTYQNYIVSCIGDSITWGAEPKTGLQMDKPYPTLLKETLKFGHVCNFGVSGSTVCNQTELGKYLGYAPIVERIVKIPKSSNIIILWAGVNDWGHGCDLGKEGDTDTTNLYGALNECCNILNETFSNSFSMLITPLPCRYDDGSLFKVKDAVIYSGNKHNIPVLNLFENSGFEDEWNETYSDGLHPSQNLTNNKIVPKIVNFIKENVK